MYAVAICPSFCIVTESPIPNPVPSSSIETPFELIISDLPSLAENPEPVMSHPWSMVVSIVFFKNSMDSSRLKSLNFLSYTFLISGTFSTSAKA